MGILLKDTGGGSLKSFIKVLFSPFTTLNNTFVSYISLQRQILQYTAQIVYIQRMLNDFFDPIDRGIYIINGGLLTNDYWYDTNEGFSDYMYRISETIGKYVTRKDESLDDFSFYVMIPNTVSYNETYLRSLVNSYIFAGITFDIITF
jgi:hypothetical protein